MKTIAIATACTLLLTSCSDPSASEEPAQFVKTNYTLLESCTNYILKNMDTLLSCDVVHKHSSFSVYETGSLPQCELIEKDTFLQRVLKTEIDFITVSGYDSLITYVLEFSDDKRYKSAVYYKKSRTAREFNWPSGPLPEIVLENYYVNKFDLSAQE